MTDEVVVMREEWLAGQVDGATGTRTVLIALFGREPSGKGDMTDRRALFQVVGGEQRRMVPPLLPVRLRRHLAARW